MNQLGPLVRLTEQLQRLPSIGPKSAQRLAFHLLKQSRDEVDQLCDAIRDLKELISYCSVCSNITDRDPCFYCTDHSRDRRIICVVETPHNVAAVERTRDFKGAYHVLMGALGEAALYVAAAEDPVAAREEARAAVLALVPGLS